MRLAILALLLAPPAIAGPAAATQETPPVAWTSAVELLEAGRLEQAESALRALLQDGENPLARDLLGVALVRQGRLDEAEREFTRAVALAPDLLSPRQHLARLYLQGQRLEPAVVQLREAAARGPLDRDLALRLAETELAAGDHAAAERELLSVVDRFESVRALLLLARLQAGRGEAAEAAANLDRAARIAPSSEEVLIARARIALAGRAPVPALLALEPLTRMHPEEAEYAYLLGVARLQIGESDGSVEALERSLAIEPRRPLTLIALGLALNGQKRFADARQVLRRGLQLEPENAEALAALAEAEEGLGDIAPAELHALRALSQAPTHAGALFVLGKLRMTQERYAEARDALSRALEADPESAKAHYQLSLAYARLDDAESSRRHRDLYRQALRRAEERLVELRTQAGLTTEGMGS
jgi:tetratricopeptide (TPR) repeat protein